MRGKLARVVVGAAVVACGVVTTGSATAAQRTGCRTQNPGWAYTTSSMTAWVSVPTSCFATRDRVRADVRIERCDHVQACTVTPRRSVSCTATTSTCKVLVRMTHGPAEAVTYYIDTDIDRYRGASGDMEAQTTLMQCTSAVVTASC